MEVNCQLYAAAALLLFVDPLLLTDFDAGWIEVQVRTHFEREGNSRFCRGYGHSFYVVQPVACVLYHLSYPSCCRESTVKVSALAESTSLFSAVACCPTLASSSSSALSNSSLITLLVLVAGTHSYKGVCLNPSSFCKVASQG